MDTAPITVDVRQISRRFGAVAAVDGMSFQVRRGEIFGLLGSNGAGKTTLLKMLTTLLPPSGGDALVAGASIVAQPTAVRQRIGYVPQLVSADGALTGRENLLAARLYGVPARERAARIGDALAFMGLQDTAERLVKLYSGGMVRRLELAQAMLHRPQVLFLDEPTVGLDPLARHAVWERCALRQSAATTVLITTHDMEEAEALCDRLAILHGGRLAVEGSPHALRADISPQATLDDVFERYCGGSIERGGHFADTRVARATARRLG